METRATSKEGSQVDTGLKALTHQWGQNSLEMEESFKVLGPENDQILSGGVGY